MFIPNDQKIDAKSFFSVLNFEISVHEEKIRGNGEDSFLFSFNNDGGIIAVFDGCGGSGARKYSNYQNKTGAYMASRVVSGAARDWFRESQPLDISILKEKVKSYLSMCKEYGGQMTAIKGSITKEFPTTAAITVCTLKESNLAATVVWAGDSRCYFLDSHGLKQLSKDDVDGLDSMDNLTADGILTNVISMSKDFDLHHKTFLFSLPCILITATDGCFGYFSTPMEFENLLLSTLQDSDTPQEWEQRIAQSLSGLSGDDFTLCGMVFGFEDFVELKKSMAKRCENLQHCYIDKISKNNNTTNNQLWEEYKTDYLMYLSKDATI